MTDVFQVFVPRVINTGVDEPDVNDAGAAAAADGAQLEYKTWLPPEVTAQTKPAPRAAPTRQDPMNSAPAAEQTIPEDNFEEQRQQAYDKGFQQGLADGQKEAQRLLAEQSQQLQLALAALREPLKWVDSELERELFLLTVAIAKQLLRHELSLRPELIENLVNKAVAALPLSNSEFEIFLNPADAEVLRNLHVDRNEPLDPAWRLLEDATLSRGGCRISSDHSRIDERLETRVQMIVAEMLGETMVPKQASESDVDEQGL